MSKTFVISSGHGDHVSGANGIIKEHDEAKKVVNRVYEILTKEYNGKGYKYHETTARNQNDNLYNIVKYHNGKKRDFDISVHFNSATPQATGSECLYYDHKAISAKMSKAMAEALGIADRGAKERRELYFLRNTTKPAILLEVCFVTSKKDTDSYKKNFEKLCQAIAKVLADEFGYKPTKKVESVSKPTRATCEKYVKVSSGDTVYSLAREFKTSVADIKKWNKLDSKYTIVKGQKLRVK